ncbi:MAG: cytochrome c [Erythrobacter sp.]|uniref:cytochrome c n=1 Tax=Erythrobacter sp. TaxID=1042 RepID=UPI0032EBAF02
MIKHLPILAGAVLVAACATDNDSAGLSTDMSRAGTMSVSAAQGRAFAQENCAGCHALDDGTSPNPNAPTLRRVANRLPEWVVEGSLERGVKLGHTSEMPVFVFEEGDVDNLLAYLETLRARD